MSSTSTLHRRLLDASLNGDVSSIRQAATDWQIANCYHPTYINSYDAHTQTTRRLRVPCGRCYHCMESKINEWVTRMYAHLEDYKHVYYVTLTYRSFQNLRHPVNKILIDKMNYALWHYDNKNKNNRYGWNPCVLCKDHYQKFLKRLRKNTGFNDITYVLSGEYGTKYGRPHFHMILFTNNDLTYNDIRKAWSVALFRKKDGTYVPLKNHKKNGTAYYFPMGHVDFHDLVTNGTLNTAKKIKIDGQYLNAAKCFSYVCKYVTKRDTANMSRVKMAYDSLFHKVTIVKSYECTFEKEKIREFFLSNGYDFNFIDVNNDKKRYTYEKYDFSPTEYIYSNGIIDRKRINFFGCSQTIDVLPERLTDFKLFFVPFCEFSRGTPIGSIYAKNHLQEFKQGVYNKPLLQDTSFVVPSYFRRKASNDLYGLRCCRETLKSKSYSLGGLVILYRRFADFLYYGIPLKEHFYSKQASFTIDRALKSDYLHFADLSTGTKVVLQDDAAISFKYDRHERKYKQVSREPLIDWVQKWLCRLDLEFDRHDILVRQYVESERHYTDSLKLIDHYLGDHRDVFENIINDAEKYRSHKQDLYESVHNSVE